MVKHNLSIIFLLFFSIGLFSQKQTPEEYIEKWKSVAIQKMHEHKIPASITLAQGILESASGNSRLAVEGNNHFGIKCHNTWTGATIYHDDDKKGECFRKYKKAEESFDDHSEFLKKKRYEALFELKITDYKGWAKGLKKAGYATNPKYPQLLIDLIERYDLAQYDKADLIIVENNPKDKKQKKDTIKGNIEDVKNTAVVYIGGKHQIEKSKNNVLYITFRDGDSFDKLSKEFDMRPWQFYKYNDFQKSYTPKAGERIYIKPKRNKAKVEFHTVKEGETLHYISQFYGVKLKKLRKYNHYLPGGEPSIGDVINLRRKKITH